MPCASSSAAVIVATDDLPFVPDHVDRGEPVLGHPEQRDQRAGSRSRPKRQPIGSSEAQVRPRPRRAPGTAHAQLLELGPVGGELRALGLDHLRRAPWPTKPSLASLRSARSTSARSSSRRSSTRRRTSSASTSSEARISTGPMVASASPPAPSNERRASRATSSCGSVARQRPAPAARCRRHPDEVAPAADAPRQLDRARHLALGLRVDQRAVDDREGRDDQRTPPRAGQVAPDLLGDEGHHRMGQRQDLARAREQQVRRGLLVAVVEARLDDLQVPVAELRPEELVEVERRVGEVVGVEARGVTASIARCSRERIQRSSRPGSAVRGPAGLDLRVGVR